MGMPPCGVAVYGGGSSSGSTAGTDASLLGDAAMTFKQVHHYLHKVIFIFTSKTFQH